MIQDKYPILEHATSLVNSYILTGTFMVSANQKQGSIGFVSGTL